MTTKKNRPTLLFVCTGNTCRSVFAEYLGRQVFGDAVAFESAGITPQPAADAKNAVFTLKKNSSIDASGHVPRDVRTLKMTNYELIIVLERTAAEVVEELGAPTSRIKQWKVRDPWGGDLAEYDQASLEIKKKLVRLKASGGSKQQR